MTKIMNRKSYLPRIGLRRFFVLGAILLLSGLGAVAAYAQVKGSVRAVAVGRVQAGKPFWVEVRVGDPNAVTGLYGIALKLSGDKYTTTYVNGSGTAGTFFGPSPLSFFRTVNGQQMDLGVTKTSAPGVSGSGTVAMVQFISAVSGTARILLSDVSAVDQNGNAIPLDTLGADIVVGNPILTPVGTGPFRVGQAFTVDVYANGLYSGSGLYGVSFRLGCDKSTCTIVDGTASAGTFLGSSPLTVFQKINSQTIDMGVTKTSAPGVTGTGSVARVQFVSSASGYVRFNLTNIVAIDQFGAQISLDTLSLVINFGSPSVKPVAVGPFQINTPFTVQVQVSDVSTPALYGIAFKLRSDMPSCTYVDGSAATGSFFSTSLLSFFKMRDLQTVDMGVTRSAAPGSTGNGTVATAQFLTTSGSSVRFLLSDVVAVDQTGAVIPVNVEAFEVTTISSVRKEDGVPLGFDLHQNYPNPFNPSTTIRFDVANESDVQLAVFDVLGRQIETLLSQRLGVGRYSVVWNAVRQPSGVYVCELRSGKAVQTRKMILAK